MEKLKSHMKTAGLSQNVFAMQIGMIPQRLNSIIKGKRKLTAAEAIMIEDATKGAVTVRDLVGWI